MSPSQAHHILRGLLKADPFRPFVLRLVNGQEYEVEDALLIALPSNPDSGTIAGYFGKELHIIGLDSIASIEIAR